MKGGRGGRGWGINSWMVLGEFPFWGYTDFLPSTFQLEGLLVEGMGWEEWSGRDGRNGRA